MSESHQPLPSWRLIEGDSLAMLRSLGDESVHCVVTSPPYWGLRDYDVDGQYGMEATPAEFVAQMVEVFREVRRVLRQYGTLWLNMGDRYATGGMGGGGAFVSERDGWRGRSKVKGWRSAPDGLKHKDLVGMPWRVAFALQADGWILRQDIIWHKSNPMPESIKDRCTKSHEYLFLLSRSPKYHYDADAIKDPVTGNAHSRGGGVNPKANTGVGWGYAGGEPRYVSSANQGKNEKTGDRRKVGFNHRWQTKQNASFSAAVRWCVERRNKRSVWTIATEAFSGAHFATFPTKLVLPCILAGCPEGGIVLDPFCGSGTTGAVAVTRRRSFIGIDLNPEYIAMADERIRLSAAQLSLEGIA